MHIKEFSILSYGPLKEIRRHEPGSFCLVFGRNEDGKSLTIDALVRLLIGGINPLRPFERLTERVADKPEGFVIIESEGAEFKIPEAGQLTDVTGLTAEECRNIFVIRNSDLSIANGDAFYKDVAGKLTGLNSRLISRIKEKLQKAGNLTQASQAARIANDQASGKLGSRLKQAADLVDEITAELERLEAEGADSLEQEAVDLKERIRTLEQQLKDMESGISRERYERGRSALDKYAEYTQQLESLAEVTEETQQHWNDLERDLDRMLKERSATAADLEKEQTRRETVIAEEQAVDAAFEQVSKRKETIDQEVRSRLETSRDLAVEIAASKAKRTVSSATASSGMLLCALSLVGALMSMHWAFFMFAGISALVGVFFLAVYLTVTRTAAKLAALTEKIRLSMARFGIETEALEDAEAGIQQIDEEYAANAQKREATRTQRQVLDHAIDQFEKTGSELETSIRKLEQEQAELLRTCGVQDLAEYSRQLVEKRKLLNKQAEQAAVLKELCSTGTGGDIAAWENYLADIKPADDAVQESSFSEQDRAEVRREIESGRARQEKLRQALAGSKETLHAFERSAADVLQDFTEHVPCDSAADLRELQRQLEAFSAHYKTAARTAVDAITLFEQIEEEENSKVADLFGEQSDISDMFARITDNKYTAVHLEGDQVLVTTAGGRQIAADKLSTGAYDQLYLTIRLSLGRKLLPDEQGFFIMDDPFIKSDTGRLAQQVNMLLEAANNGWQIIYFSAKDEVKDALETYIKSGVVSLCTTEDLFA